MLRAFTRQLRNLSCLVTSESVVEFVVEEPNLRWPTQKTILLI